MGIHIKQNTYFAFSVQCNAVQYTFLKMYWTEECHSSKGLVHRWYFDDGGYDKSC